MQLPILPPVAPMLAKSVKGVPEPGSVEGGLLYEPKWDGFRCIVFRDGDEIELGSRNERPLTRYFPELVAGLKADLPERCVVDGEIVVIQGNRLEFEVLQQRIHPAASRITKLATETPAVFLAFDLLAEGEQSLLDIPFAERRRRLESALSGGGRTAFLTPATDDVTLARRWFDVFEGAGLDGIVAKPLAGSYLPDVRAMLKIKHERTADCVVAGFRWHKSGPVVGSLLLGLYDDNGSLQHVGVCASFPMARRKELVEELEPHRMDDIAEHPWAGWGQASNAEAGDRMPATRLPGAVSRWNSGKDLSWVPLRPELVVEVAYDHMEGTRFRHTTQFRRWRSDRDPRSCTYEQLERPVRYDLASVLAGG